MKARVIAPIVALVLALVPTAVLAHSGSPAQSYKVSAGPYKLDVYVFSEPRAGQAIPIRVASQEVGGGAPRPGQLRLNVRISMEPGAGTGGEAVTPAVYPDPDNPAYYAADPVVAVHGAWVIKLSVAGPQGSGTASIPIGVGAPWAMPTWMGWAIGLLPLLGIIWFAWRQSKSLRRSQPRPDAPDAQG